MRKPLLFLSLFLTLTAIACARNVLATWDQPEPDETGITWNVYRKAGPCASPNTFNKLNTTDITEKTYTDQNVPFGTHSYQVTAQASVDGEVVESGPSNCESVTVTPSSPTDLSLQLAMAGAIPRLKILAAD